ncbi:hypothetical protein [Bacillus sp. AFS041924]|uniref:hypothetical protein n=1 Tax=Bacillus sp. AFS041924 TaxID=2033503 RepID=UPI000BFE0E92|nr:hypothetical protein [Bacillus sp. AFS041924]PGS55797.1 hypothetical protein COC46_02215 [Bacillus sp. AFS041924]
MTNDEFNSDLDRKVTKMLTKAKRKQSARTILISAITSILVFVAGIIAYQKITDDTYEGMSVIPEQRKDIGLYKGLEPRQSDYVMKGNHWKEIYNFYLKSLPTHGWVLEHKESKENEPISGGYARWIKEGQGELDLSATYFPQEDQTQVNFDLNKLITSTKWISIVPKQIEVYDENNKKVKEIVDENQINQIQYFINDEAYDTQEKPLGKVVRKLHINELEIAVYQSGNDPIYFVSEKGTKMMKPEGEFLRLIQ